MEHSFGLCFFLSGSFEIGAWCKLQGFWCRERLPYSRVHPSQMSVRMRRGYAYTHNCYQWLLLLSRIYASMQSYGRIW